MYSVLVGFYLGFSIKLFIETEELSWNRRSSESMKEMEFPVSMKILSDKLSINTYSDRAAS